MRFRKWGPLAEPVDPLETVEICKLQSAMTKDGKRPTFQEATKEYHRLKQEEASND